MPFILNNNSLFLFLFILLRVLYRYSKEYIETVSGRNKKFDPENPCCEILFDRFEK